MNPTLRKILIVFVVLAVIAGVVCGLVFGLKKSTPDAAPSVPTSVDNTSTTGNTSDGVTTATSTGASGTKSNGPAATTGSGGASGTSAQGATGQTKAPSTPGSQPATSSAMNCPTRPGVAAGPSPNSAINALGSCYYPGQIASLSGGFGLGTPPIASSLACAQQCKDHATCNSWHYDLNAKRCWGYATTASDFGARITNDVGKYDAGFVPS